MTPCRCVPGYKCEPMPNRFRRAMDWKRLWDDYDLADQGEAVYLASKEAGNIAIAADDAYGDGFEVAVCQNMQPVVISKGKYL